MKTAGKRFVSYLRVSTDGQAASGLGIEAQRAAVTAAVRDGALLAEYVECESGRIAERPELKRALQHASAANATLIVAKLDRIGRKASHVLGLLDGAGVPVVFCDNPGANKLTLGVLAVVAEEEARAISARTTAALAACKARGMTLGNPNGAAALRRYETVHGHVAATAGRVRAADDFAQRLRFAIEALRREGRTTSEQIAAGLNASGFPSRRGGRWTRGQVARLLARLDAAGDAVAAA